MEGGCSGDRPVVFLREISKVSLEKFHNCLFSLIECLELLREILEFSLKEIYKISKKFTLGQGVWLYFEIKCLISFFLSLLSLPLNISFFFAPPLNEISLIKS